MDNTLPLPFHESYSPFRISTQGGPLTHTAIPQGGQIHVES